MIFASSCVTCRRPGSELCAACAEGLVAVGPVEPPPGLGCCWSLFGYDGVGRELVLALKYRNRRSAMPIVAGAMASAAAHHLVPIDVVTWAPTSTARRRARGYDQAQLLSRSVAARLGRPHRRLLRRLPGTAQTGLDGAARREGPRFVAVRPVAGHVLVVDDVVTTGATLSAAASALRSAGAIDVNGVTAARTPLKVAP